MQGLPVAPWPLMRRSLMYNCLLQVHGIIYVVDSADARQRAESAEVFTSLLENDHVHMKPILVCVLLRPLRAPSPDAPLPYASPTGCGDGAPQLR